MLSVIAKHSLLITAVKGLVTTKYHKGNFKIKQQRRKNSNGKIQC